MAATWFVRDCGATTDFSTIVSLHRASLPFGDNRAFAFVAKGRHRVEVKWIDSRRVDIECADCTADEVFRQMRTVDGIDVFSAPRMPIR
jgi:hypothetical protein